MVPAGHNETSFGQISSRLVGSLVGSGEASATLGKAVFLGPISKHTHHIPLN